VQLTQELEKVLPELEALHREGERKAQGLDEAENHLREWSERIELFNEQVRAPAERREVQKSRITQLEQHLQRLVQREERISGELNSLRNDLSGAALEALRRQVSEHDRHCETAESEYQTTENAIRLLHRSMQEKRDEVSDIRAQQQEVVSRLNSLKEIQNAALGGDNQALQNWLNDSGLNHCPKLAKKIRVKDGWEKAADRLLNGFLGAVCIDGFSDSIVDSRPDCHFSLISTTPLHSHTQSTGRERLVDKITAEDIDLCSFLGNVFIAETLDEALLKQPTLIDRECVVTRDGTLLGANWMSFASESQLETGVLVREDEIGRLEVKQTAKQEELRDIEQEIEALVYQGDRLETRLQRQKLALNGLRADKTALHNRLGRDEARYLEIGQRIESLTAELAEVKSQVEQDHLEIDKSKMLLAAASKESGNLQKKKEQMLQKRGHLQSEVEKRKAALTANNEKYHQKALQKQRLESAVESAKESIGRTRHQFDMTSRRLAEISDALNDNGHPVEDLKGKLALLLDKKVEAQRHFSEARDFAAELENNVLEAEKKKTTLAAAVSESRERLDQRKMQRQEVSVRKQTQQETLTQQGYDRYALQEALPDDARIGPWQERLNTLEVKINRIGPVNLIAIEEFEEESQRKEYLDKQHADLTEALDTLESVIRKIDKETRARFKETFDKLNAGFNEFFPRLFGGGRAELQLTSDDLLTAGVSVMARPPGKRNSTIHLLSGGEKALSAVALLFALFRLNPAPFCMLDEVDAPLDDANVERYCNTLRTLSQVSQMIVITHNKITMEAADVLVGVTMAEPGVSRLVSVDIAEAVEMAAR